MGLKGSIESSARRRVLAAVVTFNSESDILECIETLSKQSGVDLEIVVVDNGSTDGTTKLVRERFAEVKIIESNSNRGYSGGLNEAIRRGVPEYFLALNADTSSTPEWLSCAIGQLEKNVQAGLCQPKILLYDQRSRLNSRGNQANFLFFGWPEGYGSPDSLEEEPRVIPFASGCATLCTRECIQSLGGYDDLYFMYGEDVDFGLRAHICGWDTIYSPEGAVYHKYRFKVSPAKYFLLERNRVVTLLKIYRLPTLIALLPAFVTSEIGVIVKAWREKWLIEKIRSYGHVVRHIPIILRRRAEVQGLRVRSDSNLLRLLRGGVDFESAHKSSSFIWGNRFLEMYHQFLVTLRL